MINKRQETKYIKVKGGQGIQETHPFIVERRNSDHETLYKSKDSREKKR